MPRCRKCGADITFVTTLKGKHMPVDPELVGFYPSQQGTGRYVTAAGEVLAGFAAPPFPGAPQEEGYVSHFATCPAAAEFRKGKSK